MAHFKSESFEPRTAAREDRRQAFEALGRSFCKTVAEPVTNSDSSAKRKLGIAHSSGLVDLMLAVPQGTLLDTSALRNQLGDKSPSREIYIDVVTAKGHGRPVRELAILDRAQGMSRDILKAALDNIGGDKIALSGGGRGRNLFGRGLSDFLRAHEAPTIFTFDGHELTKAEGRWPAGGNWKIKMDSAPSPALNDFEGTSLDPAKTGTVVRCVLRKGAHCHIPDHPNILDRLSNFYMLRLIAGDPNVHLVLRQYRSKPDPMVDRIQYDFPLGQVVASFAKDFPPSKRLLPNTAIRIDFLLARSDKKLRGPDNDPDARENGLLIIDDLDAVYDLTFADADFEKADFLRHIYGLVRVHGLHKVLESYLNSDAPSSPLRVDRGGFNTDHEFSRALLGFIGASLRPFYESERKRADDKSKAGFSAETKKRIDNALKQLNRFFSDITDRPTIGKGGDVDPEPPPPEPTQVAQFLPSEVRLTAGRPKQVLLVVREDRAKDGGYLCAEASEGFAVQPETEQIDTDSCPRREHPSWKHRFLCFRFTVSCDLIGAHGEVTALVDCTGDPSHLEASLKITDVLTEPEVVPPEALEFRPAVSLGRKGRRNNLVLFVNTNVVPIGHWVHVRILKRQGDVQLIDQTDMRCDSVDAKLTASHQVPGQHVARVLIPWSGTAWNQHADVIATVKVSGPKPIAAHAKIRLDEPDPNEGGFFRDVKYTELDGNVPSQYAAGTISVNTNDTMNNEIFGAGQPEFDRRLQDDPLAQQRLATLLVEEAAFRALEERRLDNKLQLPANREVASIHSEIDAYKFTWTPKIFQLLRK